MSRQSSGAVSMTDLQSELQSELQSDSQAVPTQSKPKRTRSTKTAKADSILTTEQKTVSESAQASTKRKRKPAAPTKTTPSKTQAATKNNQQIATTQVKLAWEMPTSTVGARFAQLEQELHHLKGQANEVNDQIGEILSEMDQLRAIAKSVTEESDRGEVQLPALEPPRPIPQPEKPKLGPDVDFTALRQALQEPPVAAMNSQRTRIPQHTPQTRIQSQAIPPFSPQAAQRPIRRRRNLRYYLHQFQKHALQMPTHPALIAMDSALWVLASAGLQYAIKFVATSLGIAGGGTGLIVIPVLATIYLAFFQPNANAIAIYRLLLITLGLFVGGKL
jgi:hypothetical protein